MYSPNIVGEWNKPHEVPQETALEREGVLLYQSSSLFLKVKCRTICSFLEVDQEQPATNSISCCREIQQVEYREELCCSLRRSDHPSEKQLLTLLPWSECRDSVYWQATMMI